MDGLLGPFPPPTIVDSPRADLVEREAVSIVIVVDDNWDCEETGKNANVGICTRVCQAQIRQTPAPTTYLKMSWKISSGISAKAEMIIAGWKHTPHTHTHIYRYARTHEHTP